MLGVNNVVDQVPPNVHDANLSDTGDVNSAQPETPTGNVELLKNSNEEKENIHSPRPLYLELHPVTTTKEPQVHKTQWEKHLEDELVKSRKENSELRSERDEWKKRASFARERFRSFKEESEKQLSVLRNENESITNAEKKACIVIQGLQERLNHLQIAAQDYIAEKKKFEKHIQMVESECTKLKKELQEQHKDIQYLTLESNRSHETARIATREVEAVKQELIEERKNVERIKENFIRDITFSDMSLYIDSHSNWTSIGRLFGSVKYPHLFPKDSFWDKFPYFLPSLSVSAFAFVVAIACIWLPETLHNHPLSNESIDDAEALETGNISNDDDKIIQKDENLFLNWPLMSSIIVYSIFSLYNVAYQEVFSLWVVSPGRFGGLNFTTDNVGDVLAISGIGLIVSQLFLYPSLERAFGPIKFARISAVLSIPLLQSYPFIAMLSGITLYLVINIASLLKNVLSMTIITGLFIMQNRAVEQHQRGAANGIAMTIMSIFKAIGPAGGGAV
ncbi:hypothetical protein KIW84_023487 [Lathyrus oleraceus]|uniref:Uncharacterized protein n=2 Tax=Pisum sativum TaxID=3888 RepID=A0A9D5BC26_PEA|nr:hypothetical protein KIW84_023487 [Pisum sativum]